MAKETGVHLTEWGFEKIDRDMEFLLGCAGEVFEEMGDAGLGRLLRPEGWVFGEALPPRGAQVLSVAFQLLNLVEENVANQVLRRRESPGGGGARIGLWSDTLEALKAAGITAEGLDRALKETPVEPVFTAHPTEAKRWSVLALHRRLYVLLVELENGMYIPAERARLREEIKAVLETLWRTGEIFVAKPDVAAERRNLFYYLENSFPQVLRLLDQRLRTARMEAGFLPETETGGVGASSAASSRLQFGTWIGGDRDGHPLVTAEVTRETLGEMRERSRAVLDRHLAELESALALTAHVQAPPPELDRLLARLGSGGGGGRDAGGIEEPWSAAVSGMRRWLRAGDREGYRSPAELRADLGVLDGSLRGIRAGRLADQWVRPVLRMVEVFGFHLAAVDVRQNSAFHDRAIAQLLTFAGVPGGGDYATWEESRRRAFLEEELRHPRPFAEASTELGEEAGAVLGTYRVLVEHLRRHGRSGLGYLILSMTRSVSDLLGVYLLGREAGLVGHTREGLVSRLPVVPLFETWADLRGAGAILEEFLAHPITRRSLACAEGGGEGVQPVMIGYSDSNKDAGILASQWAIHSAQATLAEVGRRNGMRIQFFHGRGGTVSRGAGPTHRFLDALPEGTLEGGLRITEQGEVVAQKYANPLTAALNLELAVAGAIRNRLLPASGTGGERLAQWMPSLAEASAVAYRDLVGMEGFLEFHRQATPIDVIEQSRIGSRPSRRTPGRTLETLRAIPWVFSWTQARFYLPGWYGVGMALEEMKRKEAGAFEALRGGWRGWTFLRYVLSNVESSLESASEEWMQAYAGLVEDAAVRERVLGRIVEEYRRTRRMMAELGGGPLRERRPRFFKTLHARDAGLALLHRDQIRLLRAWRREPGEGLLRELLLNANAIASGLRTTG